MFIVRTLILGERQYEQRVEDIRLLRLEIIRLRKEKNLLSKGIENMTDLRLEVLYLFGIPTLTPCKFNAIVYSACSKVVREQTHSSAKTLRSPLTVQFLRRYILGGVVLLQELLRDCNSLRRLNK